MTEINPKDTAQRLRTTALNMEDMSTMMRKNAGTLRDIADQLNPPLPTMPAVPTGWKTVAELGDVTDLSQFSVYGNQNGPWLTTNKDSYWSADRVLAEDGCLVLLSKLDGPNGLPMGGACLWKPSTKKFGRFEYDAKLELGAGVAELLWPTKDDTWPVDGEIDIREIDGRSASGGEANYHQSNQKNDSRKLQLKLPTDKDWTAWHRMALEWDATSITEYIDDVLMKRITNADAPKDGRGPIVPWTLDMRLTFQQEGPKIDGRPAEVRHRYRDLRLLTRA